MKKTKRTISALALGVAAIGPLALSASVGSAETGYKEGVTVSVSGKLTPTTLPRRGTAPIGISFGGTITATDAVGTPKLTKLTIALNRNGRLDTHGLPRCRRGQIDPSTNREALTACGSSLVGEGSFASKVKIPEQSPFPSKGKVLAFNGRLHGRPAILAHIYGIRPLPISYVLPFTVSRSGGTYGTLLEASFPKVTGEWGYVTGIAMNLHRSFSSRGRTHGYLNAGCPAPSGFRRVAFPLARATFVFDGGLTIAAPPLVRSCTVKG
ncbi:MAG: hypothetical protein ACJ75S_07425 [Solirubrobacterales bacterium]